MRQREGICCTEVKAFGTIHILHSNAGIVLPEDNPNAPIDGWNKVLGVNLTGMMLVCRTVANVMIEHQHGGAIINTASKSAHIISGNGFSYAANQSRRHTHDQSDGGTVCSVWDPCEQHQPGRCPLRNP